MKKILSTLLAIAMVITMLPVAAFAASSAPLELVASINEDVATIKLNTTEAFEMSALDFTVNVPDGCTITVIEKGANYADIGAAEPSISDNYVSILASQFNTATTVPAGKEFIVIKVDTSSATSDTLSFSIEVTAAANFNDDAYDWENTSITSNEITKGTPAVDGYTATLSTTASNNEVVSEGSINVNVAVSHNSDTVFNAGEIKLTYDSTKLTPNTTSLNAMVADGTLSGYQVNTNELVIEAFGSDKTMPYTYSIPFTAAEVSAETTGTVTLTRAAFILKDNANSSDLVEAAKTPESLIVTIKVAMVNVALTNSADSTSTTTTTQKGVAYTFAPSDTANYTYSNVTATVDGNEVTVTDNGNGTFTIAAESVTGDIALTYTKTAKSYTVSYEGAGANDITGDKPTTATYGKTLNVTLPDDKVPGTEAGYTYGISAKIGETSVGTYDSTTRTLTIQGTDITGNITITVTKQEVSATQVTITVSGDSGLTIKDATSNTATVEKGTSVTLVLTEEEGYTYKVVDGSNNEVSFTDGEYTFTANESVTFTATKTLDVATVQVTEYVKVDNYIVYLVTYNGTLASGKVPTYDSNVMFWSDKYDAYCWLVIDSTLTVDTAKTKIDAQTGTATKVDYGMDINETNTTDAADAQLVWNMYNALYSDFTSVSMAQFLAADQNATSDANWGLNVQDAQVIITAILAGNATT